MAYRILVGSIQQESNSFSPVSSAIEDFDRAQGMASLEKLSVFPLLRPDVEIIPSIYANAVPSGPMKREVFDILLRDLLSYVQNGIDGVFLYLQGALEVDGVGSGDAAIVQAVREHIGQNAIISVAVDFHANIAPALLEAADIVCAYRTAPHTDMEETQQRAAALLMYCLENAIHPACAMVRVPILLTGDRVTTCCQPAVGLMREMERMETGTGMVSMSFCFGQPWVDTQWVGACVLAFAQDRQTACNAAETLAKRWWDKREQFEFDAQAALPEEAFTAALLSDVAPVFISDSGDNTTAGAAGDRTNMLWLAVSMNAKNTLIAGITDTSAVARCQQAGAGASISLRLLTESDPLFRSADVINCQILRVGNILGWHGEDAGSAAVLRHDGVDIIFTERRCAFTSPEVFSSIGVNPERYQVVVVKLGYLYPRLRDVAKRSIYAFTAGASSANLVAAMYRYAHRPAYPIDADADFKPERFSYGKDMKTARNWHGIFFTIQPGKSYEYIKRHKNVPEPLKQVLRDAGIRNYTIWRHGDLLFACYLVVDERRMERVLEASSDYGQWRKEMESIIDVDCVTGQKEWPMEQAFFLP